MRTQAKCNEYCVIKKKFRLGRCKEIRNRVNGERDWICHCVPYKFVKFE